MRNNIEYVTNNRIYLIIRLLKEERKRTKCDIKRAKMKHQIDVLEILLYDKGECIINSLMYRGIPKW